SEAFGVKISRQKAFQAFFEKKAFTFPIPNALNRKSLCENKKTHSEKWNLGFKGSICLLKTEPKNRFINLLEPRGPHLFAAKRLKFSLAHLEKAAIFDTFPVMNYITTTRLNQLKKDYQIFLPEKNTVTKEMLLAGHYPPLLVNQEQLLWDGGTLTAALEWDVPGLWARLSGSDSPRKIMEEVLLCENRGSRYSWEEVDRIYALAGEPQDESFSALVFGKKNLNQLENLAFYRNASPRVAMLLNQKAIDFKLADNLMALDPGLRDFLLENQCFIAYSFSQKRLFFQHFHEACERDTLSVEKALLKLKAVFAEEDPVAALFTWRYPQLSRMEKQFQDFIERHLKKSGVSLKAPPYFEGKDYSVEFAFSTPKNLNKRVQALKNLEAHAHELFELL
ncbi:MAG: hypothetical protein JXR70_15620, partial [Spirochaetales bacterium]|nr:hypothetical protein [Spirochaetales bacterium]